MRIMHRTFQRLAMCRPPPPCLALYSMTDECRMLRSLVHRAAFLVLRRSPPTSAHRRLAFPIGRRLAQARSALRLFCRRPPHCRKLAQTPSPRSFPALPQIPATLLAPHSHVAAPTLPPTSESARLKAPIGAVTIRTLTPSPIVATRRGAPLHPPEAAAHIAAQARSASLEYPPHSLLLASRAAPTAAR